MINKFDPGRDVIDVSWALVTTFGQTGTQPAMDSQLAAQFRDTGPGEAALLNLDATTTITLTAVPAHTLLASDFHIG